MNDPLDILKHYWGYEAFRPLQADIIRSVLDGKDTLALLPTGGGKSICFQVPALCMEGICVVVSPLIALMKDQVAQLNRRNIKALAIFSGMSKREIDIALDNCIYGGVRFLYASPERLKTDLFIERARQMNISLLAIDEAHCISQWGYDFRPPYLEIARFKEALAIPKIIALTATATKEVKEDILDKLEMSEPAIFQKSFARANLSYSVFHLEGKEKKLLEVLQKVPGTSIVYVRSRKRAVDVAGFLQRNGISSGYYHGGLNGQVRSERQDAWLANQIRVMVATNAFGMGIDKPDVRTVIHLDLPDSLEAYYQEAGRAGRDEQKAYAVVLYHTQDLTDLRERVLQAQVTMDVLKTTYRALANYYKMAIGSTSTHGFDFHLEAFTKTYQLPTRETFAAIKKLTDEGLIQVTDGFHQKSKLIFLLERSGVYKYQVANQKLDALIKAVLRLNGGEAFSNYVQVDEGELSRMIKRGKQEVMNELRYLHHQEVVDYQPSTDIPQLTFLTPRQNPDRLVIDAELLEKRRKLAIAKAESVIDYVQSDACRTNIFQTYFDEVPDGVCGICDNDLNKKKQSASLEIPFEKVLQLLKEPKSLSELTSVLADYPDKLVMDALRLLLDEEKIVEEGGKFRRLR
ncbi:MAG: ATP-dependent DNA helicase RecQ [Bacteroidota bacterium]